MQLCPAMGGPYGGKLLEFGESVLAHLSEVGRGSGNPAPKLADRWKSAVWLGKSDLSDEHLVRTDEGVVHARSVRRLAEHSWSEENLRAVVETPQKWKSTTVVIPGVSSSSRGEKRTETQENVFVKKRLMMKSPQRPATPVTPSDDPVKRRPLKKTDPKSDDVLMRVEIEDSDLLNTVNTLLNDETGEEAMPWSDESEETKILTVLDDPKEVEKGRHKELRKMEATRNANGVFFLSSLFGQKMVGELKVSPVAGY